MGDDRLVRGPGDALHVGESDRMSIPAGTFVGFGGLGGGSGGGSVGEGTSFPAGPSIGQFFYRTDLQQLFLYEGASNSYLVSVTPVPILPSPVGNLGYMYLPVGYAADPGDLIVGVYGSNTTGGGTTGLSQGFAWVPGTPQALGGSSNTAFVYKLWAGTESGIIGEINGGGLSDTEGAVYRFKGVNIGAMFDSVVASSVGGGIHATSLTPSLAGYVLAATSSTGVALTSPVPTATGPFLADACSISVGTPPYLTGSTVTAHSTNVVVPGQLVATTLDSTPSPGGGSYIGAGAITVLSATWIPVSSWVPTYAADPASPDLRTGDLYYNTTAGEMRYYNGSVWVQCGGGVRSIAVGTPVTGNVTFNGAGVTQSGNTFTFSGGGGGGAIPYDPTILAEPALVHFWKFNEAAGATTFADSVGSLNITYTSGTVTAGAGSRGGYHRRSGGREPFWGSLT